MPVISGGVGGGPAAGTYLPVADATSVTVDTTTYANPVHGTGKLTTLVFPNNTAMLAMAVSGDAFPRAILTADPSHGWAFGDGTQDPWNSGAFLTSNVAGAIVGLALIASDNSELDTGLGSTANVTAATRTTRPFQLGLSGARISSGAGVPGGAGEVGDLYIRTDPASDATYLYRCTVAGGFGVATWAPITGA